MSDPVLLRTSERSDFKRCPWLWHETWVKGLRSKREPTWAWFGTAIHKGLEVYYPEGKKRGKLADVLAAFEAALDGEVRRVYTEGGEIDDVEIVDGRALGIAMLRGYVEHYGKDSHWHVVHTEQPFQIDVVHPDDDNRVIVVYAGTWDMVVYDLVEKVYKVVDHKTRRSFPKNWAFYNINDQAGSYLWVGKEVLVHKGILKKKDNIEGLVFNALRKALPDDRPLNAEGLATNKPTKQHYLDALGFGTAPRGVTVADLERMAEERAITVIGDVSKVQPQPLFHREEVYRSPQERVTQAQRVQAEALVMDAMRTGTLPLFKTPTEDCVRCPLFEYCELHEQNPEEAEEFARATLTRRDPYRDHREAMKEGGVQL